MSHRFACPSCHRTFLLGAESAVRPGICPACNAPLVVSAPVEAECNLVGRPLTLTQRSGAIGGVVLLLGIAAIIAFTALPRRNQAAADEARFNPVAAASSVREPAEPPAQEPRGELPRLELSPPADAPRTFEPSRLLPQNQPPEPASPETSPVEDEKKSKAAQPAPAPATPAATSIKRLHQLDAEELRKQLLQIPEVALDAVRNSSANLVTLAARCRQEGEPYLGPALLTRERLDLACLPLVTGVDSVLGKEPAEDLQAMSRKLRVAIESCIPKGSGDPRPDADRLRKKLLDKDAGWLKPEAVRCMRQMLAAENRPIRQVMVEVMARIPGRVGTETLAMMALTDLAPEVREAAVKALADRPADEYRPILLGGLRYPWNAVVAHAAEALAALEGKQAMPALVKALIEPDPNLPVTFEQGKQKLHVVRELVRVNHLANCVLCHAPSFDSGDLVRGAVPIPGQPLPGPATTPQYYETGESFVRADITYLRQHFSILQPVQRSGQWPNNQRFDYLLRLRPLTNKKEVEVAETHKLKAITPQKEILVRAVKELTGKDPGETPEEWRKLQPDAARPEQLDERRQHTIEKEWGRFLPIRHPERAGER